MCVFSPYFLKWISNNITCEIIEKNIRLVKIQFPNKNSSLHYIEFCSQVTIKNIAVLFNYTRNTVSKTGSWTCVKAVQSRVSCSVGVVYVTVEKSIVIWESSLNFNLSIAFMK